MEETKKSDSKESKSKLTNVKEKVSSGTDSVAKKTGASKAIVIVLGVVVVLCCCIMTCCLALALVSDSESNSDPLNLDEILEETDGDNDGTVTNPLDTDSGKDAEEITTADKGASASSGRWKVTLVKAEQQGDSLVLTLSAENLYDYQQYYSSLGVISLVNGDGDSYSQNYFYTLSDDEEMGKLVQPGERTSGKVVFRVSDDPSSLKLVVDDYFTDESGEIKIK